jgi:hypothetical protein
MHMHAASRRRLLRLLQLLFHDLLLCSNGSVGIDVPKIEVRFEHLRVSAPNVLRGSRALPTLFNFIIDLLVV